jgi:hypothetical protein
VTSCPKGWRRASRRDIEHLMKNVGPTKAINHATKCSNMFQVSLSPSNQATPSSTMRKPHQNPKPMWHLGHKVWCFRPSKAIIGVKWVVTWSSHGFQVSPKETFLFQCVQGEETHHPTYGMHAPMKVQVTLFLHDQIFICQGPAKTNKYALQGSISHKYHSK